MGWIDVVVDTYAESEAPPKFFYWSAMAAISAVMKKQVFLERFQYILYPNIYVFLIAGSGMKKGIPISVAKTLVKKAGESRIISGRNSMPAIIKELGKAKSLENGGIVKNAQAFLISGELAAFFVKDPDAMTILTDIYNTHEHGDYWENTLKGTGVDRLKEPCICLLGATNEEHFGSAVSDHDTKGGFIARTFIVLSIERGKLNSLTKKPKIMPDTDYLALYLKELAKLSGGFIYGPNADKTYDDWYYPFMQTIASDPTGTYNRLGDQVLKVAMLLALSECPQLVIKESHIIEAIRVCTECTNGMRQVTMGAGKSSLAGQTKLVMRELILAKNHILSRRELLQKYWGEFTSFDLDRIVETLLSADCIEERNPGSPSCVYVLKKAADEMFTKAVRSIQ